MCAPGVIGVFVVTRPVAPSNVVPTASAAVAATPPTPLMLTASPFGEVAKSPPWVIRLPLVLHAGNPPGGSISAMNASLNSLPTYSWNSSERKR